MNLRLAALLLLAAASSLATTTAQACTPIMKVSPPAERRRYLQEVADNAARPQLALMAERAADIFVGHVASQAPAPLSDIPEPYRANGQPFAPDLAPVRYVFAVDAVLKGAPGQAVAFKAAGQLAQDLSREAWMVRHSDHAASWSSDRSDRDFWHSADLVIAESEGGPGDCSFQWSYRTDRAYLIARDKAGGFLAAIPLEPKDPLPALTARLLADPRERYPYRPDLRAYLGLKGALLRVVMTRCGERAKVRVLEVLAPPTGGAVAPDKGEMIELYTLVPSASLGGCRMGASYILDGWLAMQLHPIQGQTVTFDDRWMQLRFTGDKRLSLAELRRISGAPPR